MPSIGARRGLGSRGLRGATTFLVTPVEARRFFAAGPDAPSSSEAPPPADETTLAARRERRAGAGLRGAVTGAGAMEARDERRTPGAGAAALPVAEATEAERAPAWGAASGQHR